MHTTMHAKMKNTAAARLIRMGILVIVVMSSFLVMQSIPARAAGVVGTGTPDSCTEEAFDKALQDGGKVTFNCGKDPVFITITQEKLITGDVQIVGDAKVSLSGKNRTRLFRVQAGGKLTLEKITLLYGLAKDRDDNKDGNGGAVFNDGGIVTLNAAQIGSSRAERGGAIYNKGGALTLINSTLYNNTGNSYGGAIANESGIVKISNSTLSNNFASDNGGAILNALGTIEIAFSTLFNNAAGSAGSAILNAEGAAITANNTVIANRQVPGDPFAGNCAGVLLDGGSNIQFPGTSCGESLPAADPLLGDLADNGGFVQTHALKDGTSPAVNKADVTACRAQPINSKDAREERRPNGGGCDIGAYEFNPQKPGKGFGEQCTPIPKAGGPVATRPAGTRRPTRAAPSATPPAVTGCIPQLVGLGACAKVFGSVPLLSDAKWDAGVIRQLNSGEIIKVIDGGSRCVGGSRFVYVATDNGTGWVPESDAPKTYYIGPTQCGGNSQPDPTQAATRVVTCPNNQVLNPANNSCGCPQGTALNSNQFCEAIIR